jgi:CO dehydrogenase nickel-insertion accessory protein CooC1
LNRLNGQMPAALRARIEAMDIPLLGVILADSELMEFEFSGRPLVDLGDESPVYQAVDAMMDQIL